MRVKCKPGSVGARVGNHQRPPRPRKLLDDHFQEKSSISACGPLRPVARPIRRTRFPVCFQNTTSVGVEPSHRWDWRAGPLISGALFCILHCARA